MNCLFRVFSTIRYFYKCRIRRWISFFLQSKFIIYFNIAHRLYSRTESTLVEIDAKSIVSFKYTYLVLFRYFKCRLLNFGENFEKTLRFNDNVHGNNRKKKPTSILNDFWTTLDFEYVYIIWWNWWVMIDYIEFYVKFRLKCICLLPFREVSSSAFQQVELQGPSPLWTSQLNFCQQ